VTAATPLDSRALAAATLGALAAFSLPLALSASAAHQASAPPQVDLSRARGTQTEASIAIDPLRQAGIDNEYASYYFAADPEGHRWMFMQPK
jgi:hypothetical protein